MEMKNTAFPTMESENEHMYPRHGEIGFTLTRGSNKTRIKMISDGREGRRAIGTEG